MKFHLQLLVFALLSGNALCQQLGVFGGYSTNAYYDMREENPHFQSEYKKGDGFTAGIYLNNIRIVDKLKSDTFHLSFGIKFAKYSGEVRISEGGLGGSSTISFQTEKYTIGINVIPVTIRIYKELKLSIGGEINFLVSHKEDGHIFGWSMNNGSTNTELKDTDLKINSPMSFGINLMLGYDFKIGNYYKLTTFYNFYGGITSEFYDVGAAVRSYRHQFNIGIAKQL